jgi:hypothetical protein
MEEMIMNKTIKAGLKVYGVLTTVIGAKIIYEMITSKQRTKKNIEAVWNNVKDDLVKELDLEKVPVLKYARLDGAVMCVKHTIETRQSMFSFTKTVVNTIPEYAIYIDLDKTLDLVNFYYKMTFYLKPSVRPIVIKQLLLHETRHIWQAQEGFYNGTQLKIFDYDINQGHGEKKEELDANAFALSKTANHKEAVVFHLQTLMQNVGNKFYIETEQRNDLVKAKNEFLKVFNPMAKFFN